MSFAEQLTRWVRRAIGSDFKRNINRLIDRGLRRRLLDVMRGPVLGTRGEAGLAVTVVPDPPTDQPVEGLYGQPYPGNPHPDPGALWFESAGFWTGLLYPDWQDDFLHPPGVLAGNVFFEGSSGHLISWHWYPSGGPPGNSVKYLSAPLDFDAWVREEQQAAAPGGDLSRDILHVGKRLYRLPDHWACIGACAADNWLFMVAMNTSGRGRNWIWSGYDVDVTGTCNSATTLAVWVKANPMAPPDMIFSVGMSVRLGVEERVIQTFLQSGGPDCWLIRLNTALPAVPDAGTPIEIVKPGGAFGTYTTRVFAVATVTNTEGDLEVVPGSTLYDIADLVDTAWTQQFVAHPDGRDMMGLIYKVSVDVNRDIHRLVFDTAPTPPTVNHTIETRVEKRDEVYLEAIDEPRVVNSCSDDDFVNTRQRALIPGAAGCFSCPGDTGAIDYAIAYDAVYSGARTRSTGFDFTEKMGRKIQNEYKSRTIAVDYDSSGNELIATLDIEFESTITINVVNSYNYNEYYQPGSVSSIDPYCVTDTGPIWFTNSGSWTSIRDESSSFIAERHLETNLSVDISVNGQKKINLGKVQDDLKWTNTDDDHAAYDITTETFEGTGWGSVPPDDPDVSEYPICGNPGAGDRTFYYQSTGSTRTFFDHQQSGTLVGGVPCSEVPTYDYETFFPVNPIAYDIRNVATPLLFMDLRAGVYVTQGREGIVDDIYGLVETAGNPTFSDRQMYPYTVEAANFLPSKPALQDRDNYDQHWAAWGVDFVSAGMVGSPAPVWLIITQMDKKGPTDLVNPINWQPSDFIRLGDAETVEQGAALRAGKLLVNVFVELPTAGQETLQAVELRNPSGDPLGLIGIPGATKITNIGAV